MWSLSFSHLLVTTGIVTHPVVSQVNPHVHLFFFAPRGSAGKPVAHSKGKGMYIILFMKFWSSLSYLLIGWRGNFLLSAAEQALKHELTKNFKGVKSDLAFRWPILIRVRSHPWFGTSATTAWPGLVVCFPSTLWWCRHVGRFRHSS